MEPCRISGTTAPINKDETIALRASHIRRRLIEAWADFAGNSSPENAQKLHDVRLAAELLLREVLEA